MPDLPTGVLYAVRHEQRTPMLIRQSRMGCGVMFLRKTPTIPIVVLPVARRTYGNVLGGKFSRMLDLGGAPSSSSGTSEAAIKALNLNKNCHLQAIVFDFSLLTKSMEQSQSQPSPQSPQSSLPPPNPPHASNQPAATDQTMMVPNMTKIQELAKLLNVNITGASSDSSSTSSKDNRNDDDLSLILRETPATTRETPPLSFEQSQPPLPPPPPPSNDYIIGGNDIRSKYADKLKRVTGSSHATLDTSSISINGSGKGDAEYLVVARARATSTEASSGSGTAAGSQWMAATGTGQLLHYLHLRSMKLGVVATPVAHSSNNALPVLSDEARQMNDFTKQLKDKVRFDVLVTDQFTAAQLVATTFARLQQPASSSSESASFPSVPISSSAAAAAAAATIPPNRCLWISDRDDCLRAAKDAGLLTARILLRPNARRGNVSAHYTVTHITDVQTIVNEINGISFNAVLRGAG